MSRAWQRDALALLGCLLMLAAIYLWQPVIALFVAGLLLIAIALLLSLLATQDEEEAGDGNG